MHEPQRTRTKPWIECRIREPTQLALAEGGQAKAELCAGLGQEGLEVLANDLVEQGRLRRLG